VINTLETRQFLSGDDMRILSSVVKCIDTCNEWVGRVIQWAIVALVIVFIIESVLRKGFSAPQIWFTETSHFLFGYYIMFGSVYTYLHGGHVAIDLFSERLSHKWRHILAIGCLLLFTFVFSIAMVKGGIPIAVNSWKAMEQGHSFWRPPIAHFRTVIPVAFFLIFLQGISSLIKHVAEIKGIEL
jgi:TRAP-type mannitol/chloroaromatic compound transport system permease small subunit